MFLSRQETVKLQSVGCFPSVPLDVDTLFINIPLSKENSYSIQYFHHKILDHGQATTVFIFSTCQSSQDSLLDKQEEANYFDQTQTFSVDLI